MTELKIKGWKMFSNMSTNVSLCFVCKLSYIVYDYDRRITMHVGDMERMPEQSTNKTLISFNHSYI